MPSRDRPPDGGPLNLADDGAPGGASPPGSAAADGAHAASANAGATARRSSARAAERGEIVSLTALLTARLLRLKPLHGRGRRQRVARFPGDPRWALSLGFLLFVLLFLAMLVFFFVSTEAHAASEGINFDKPSKDCTRGWLI